MYFMSKQTKLVSIHFNIFCHFQTMLNFPTDILTRATMGSHRRSVTVTVVQNCRRNGDTTAMCRNVQVYGIYVGSQPTEISTSTTTVTTFNWLPDLAKSTTHCQRCQPTLSAVNNNGRHDGPSYPPECHRLRDTDATPTESTHIRFCFQFFLLFTVFF